MIAVPSCLSRAYFDAHEELFPAHSIASYPWAAPDSYRPLTTIRAAHSDSALFVRMQCRESDPRTTIHEWNGRVWTDSAMEFFIEPLPGCGYFNFEMNAAPALLLHFGMADTAARKPVEWDRSEFGLCSRRFSRDGADWWEVCVTVPFAMLSHYVPAFRPETGCIFRANAYKCGDDCAEPHYGSLFPIDAAKIQEPSFHRPAYFGEWKLM